jgi:hypothetical protein
MVVEEPFSEGFGRESNEVLTMNQKPVDSWPNFNTSNSLVFINT